MEQSFKTMLTFGVLVLVLFGLYFFSDWFSKATGYVLGDDEKMNLATCLKSKNAVFYTSSTCPDCERQLDLFGKDAKRMINIFTCSSIDECPDGGVPAWKINGQIYYGIKELEELISMSGCDIN